MSIYSLSPHLQKEFPPFNFLYTIVVSTFPGLFAKAELNCKKEKISQKVIVFGLAACVDRAKKVENHTLFRPFLTRFQLQKNIFYRKTK